MEPATLEVFRKMAAAMGVSVGRCIGDWCADTVDGAQFVMQKMQEAKKTPALVMREMEAMSAGLLSEIQRASRDVAAGRATPGAVARERERSAAPAPSGAGRRGSKPPVL
jgi:hypothetical protein